MKKFLSMLLVLCMVVTTLMGVMVIDVNAGVILTEVDNTSTPRKWTLTYTAQDKNAKNILATGSYTLVPQTVATGGQASYDLGTVSSANKLGMDGYHFNFKGFTFQNGTAGLTNSYLRLQTTYKDASAGATAPSETNRFATENGALNIADGVSNTETTPTTPLGGDGTSATGKVYRYTFYAYSASPAGHNLTVRLTGGGSQVGTIQISANKIYSAEGVPHKVDLYIWSDSKDKVVFGETGTNTSEYLYYVAIVDGAYVATNSYARVNEAANSGMKVKSGTFYPTICYDLAQNTGTSFTVTETDEYVMHPKAEAGWVELDRDKAADELFKLFNIGANKTSISSTAKTDFVKEFKYATALEKALTSATDGTTSSVEIYAKDYNAPASMYTDYASSNVKVVSAAGHELTADELSDLESLDNHYLKINGVYVIPKEVDNPLPYTTVLNTSVAPNKTTVDGYNTTRIRVQSYVSSSIPEGEDAYGGLRTGFVKYTSEPRGTFTFSAGTLYYDQAGYISLGGTGRYKKAEYLTEYITKPILTAQFDLFVPEYTATKDSRVYISVFGNTDEETAGDSKNNYRANMGSIVFTTNGKTSGDVSGNIVDVVGNAWNTIGIQFDTSEVAEKGYKVTLYVNGEIAKEYYTTNNTKGGGKTLADGVGTTNIAWINYMRMYWPDYTSIGIMNDKWVVGEYTPGVTDTTGNIINDDAINGVTAYDESNLITYDSSVYATEEALVNAMSGYEAVYEYETDFSGIDAAYDATDGAVETKDGYTYTSRHIKRWIENSPYFTITGEGENTVYALKSADDSTLTANQKKQVVNITSAKWVNETEATLVVNSSMSDQTIYSGVCSTFDEICNANPGLRTKKLVGFAVNETGKLPRVYTLQEVGTELYSLAYDETTNTATLNYREFGGTENIPFVLVVGAYDADGRLLALDVSDDMVIDSAREEDGVNTKTFTADFGELDPANVKVYRVFAFNSIAECKPLIGNYSMNNPAYVVK